MNYLEEAKQLAVQPGQAAQEKAQTYAAIALVEAVQDQTRKLVGAIAKLAALAKPVAEKKAAAPRKTTPRKKTVAK